jgi:Transposase DDE domain
MNAKNHEILAELHALLHSDSFNQSHKIGDRSFVRSRVLGFSDLIKLQLNQLVKSLSVELSKGLQLLGISAELSYSKQAFSQARQKLSHSAFQALNKHFVTQYYATEGYKLYQDTYLLLAVDGSLLQLPEQEALAQEFGRWKNNTAKGLPMCRCSVLYDVLNHVVLASELDTYAIGENALYERHLQSCTALHTPRLYLMDRNYPSFQKFIEIEQANDRYVMRCASNYCKEVAVFVASEQDEATLTISLNKERIAQNDFLKQLGVSAPKEIKVRIVRIKLTDSTYEYLLTNTDFTDAELKDLYQLRWRVEGFYFILKDHMQLENFTSKTTEGIKQDFFAKIFTFNIAQLFVEEAQIVIDKKMESKKKKRTNTST